MKYLIAFILFTTSVYAQEVGDIVGSVSVCTEEASLELFYIHKTEGMEAAANAFDKAVKNETCFITPPYPYTVTEIVEIGDLDGTWEGRLIYTESGLTIPQIKKIEGQNA